MTYLGTPAFSYKAPWTMDNLEKEVNVNMSGQLSLKKKKRDLSGISWSNKGNNNEVVRSISS